VTVVLDSWAILRLLYDEQPAAAKVGALLEAQRPLVSWINLGEVFYIVRRATDDVEATATVRDLREVLTAELPSRTRIVEAARIKAEHPMAYADAFAASVAIAHGATLWTGDPELLIVGAPWEWRDIRT
jgi:predicted nucleic acid-binding protein